MKDQNQQNTGNDQYIVDETPPFFDSWNSWYVIVLGNLALMIILFFVFTKYFD